MTSQTVPAPNAADATPTSHWAGDLAIAVLVGLVVGMLTAPAQGLLPGSVSSFANSAGPWSLAAFIVARRARSVVFGAVFASATLAMCEIGYAISTELRGDSNATSTVVFWLTAAVLAGPPLGVAARWSTSASAFRRGSGFGVICGVLIGEGLWAWSHISDTTDWRYWMGEVLIGAALMVVVLFRRRSAITAASCVGVAAVVALVVYATASFA